MKLAGFLLFLLVVACVACIVSATVVFWSSVELMWTVIALAFVVGVLAAYIIRLFGFGYLRYDAWPFRLKIGVVYKAIASCRLDRTGGFAVCVLEDGDKESWWYRLRELPPITPHKFWVVQKPDGTRAFERYIPDLP